MRQAANVLFRHFVPPSPFGEGFNADTPRCFDYANAPLNMTVKI